MPQAKAPRSAAPYKLNKKEEIAKSHGDVCAILPDKQSPTKHWLHSPLTSIGSSDLKAETRAPQAQALQSAESTKQTKKGDRKEPRGCLCFLPDKQLIAHETPPQHIPGATTKQADVYQARRYLSSHTSLS